MPESSMKRVTSSFDNTQPRVDAEVDFAVNAHAVAPPPWLREVIRAGVDKLGFHPDDQLYREVTAVIATKHGVEPEQVMLLNGSTEGFSLLPKLRPAWPVIIHPGFTAAESCLEESRIDVDRVVLKQPFPLDKAVEVLGFGGVHEEADLVVINNPVNPSGRLYTLEELSRLAEPWRYLVVDEAFLDAAEGVSMLERVGELPGLIVLRSLTWTWSLAGLRCGYLISDAETVKRLSQGRQQSPVGTLQLLAIKAVMEPGGRGETELPAISAELGRHRSLMSTVLSDAGFTVYPSDAPYLLVEPPVSAGAEHRPVAVEALRLGLAARGITVQRCDGLPGLDLSFWRLAVRTPAEVAVLLHAVKELNNTESDQEGTTRE